MGRVAVDDRRALVALAAAVAACSAPSSGGGGDSLPPVQESAGGQESDLAKRAQNPVADLISLPFQNNTNVDWGPRDQTQNVLNIQPVVPFKLGEDWNLITRTILPVVQQPVPGDDSVFGLGDTVVTGFFSPRASKGLVWGVGPVALLPTSTDDALGAGEWGGGAGAVALLLRGPWVAGGLVQNVWSFESSAVNQLLLQPFVNYNLRDGWYLVTAPILTANWEAPSGERWTIPIGGGAGKVMRFGKQPVNVNLQYYNNVEHPTLGADWQLRFQVQLLFPKG